MNNHRQDNLQRPIQKGPDPVPSPSVPDELGIPAAPVPVPVPNNRRVGKTVLGLFAFAIGFVLTAINAPGDAAFLADGFQPEDIGPALTAAGAILTALGVRFAKQ